MAASESTRARRFALPDLADERAGESIEAFLHGRRPKLAKSRSRAVATVHAAAGDSVALRTMPGRLEWNEALDRESARAARYERPAAVAVLELKPLRPTATLDSWLRIHAGPLGQVLLRGSRATDLVARVANGRFQILLPETTAEAAGEFVARVVGECTEQLREVGAPIKVTSSVAASSPDLALRDALSQALRSVEAH